MLGVIIVAHSNLGEELLRTAEIILHKKPEIKNVLLEDTSEFEEMRIQVKDAVKSVDKGNGVIILTDLFGGTPSNICITLLDEMNIEVLSGVNLPILLKMDSVQVQDGLKEATAKLKEHGRKNISSARDFLNKKADSGK